MRNQHGLVLSSLLAAIVLFVAVPCGAITDDTCTDCHQGSGGEPAEISHASLVGSVHEDLSCTDCHADVTAIPHPAQLAMPDCGACHDDVAADYVQHGMGLVGKNPAVPTCAQCHGSHQIRPAIDPASQVNAANLPATCGACHENQEFIAKQGIRFKHPVEVYQSGVHAQTIAGGDEVAASCNDCHVKASNHHAILPPGDIESTINFFNISATCGTCHTTIQREFDQGIHGQLVARGDVSAPTCTHCHGEHGILHTDDPRSRVSPYRVAEATCTPCHDSANLNERFDVPTGKDWSRVDSYHGLKSRGGDKTVANCSSCHGAHLILPSKDPASSVNPNNLVNTCGSCHTGISAATAMATPIHDIDKLDTSGWPYWIKIAYKLLILMVIGGMAGYCFLDYLRQVRNVLRKEQVRRMETDEVLQHALLAITFTVLVITGFSLRFYDAWWSKLIFSWEGGAAARGLIHRSMAVLMIFGALWHLGYLFTAKGRVFLKDIAPGLHDAQQALGMFMYNLGRTNEHPHMRRFSFVEKAEYWALIWGTVVMVMTGLALWFESSIVDLVGKQAMEVFLVIHYYEAWLAMLAILVWHMYGVVFNPHVYPMNPSWLTGKMPREMFETEHPAAQSPGNVHKIKRLGKERDV
ncbi:cytochrome b/b6 domain-containing protein [bacterium]|nr:cytochrome b/b6 domain-containing protein [bacterium]